MDKSSDQVSATSNCYQVGEHRTEGRQHESKETTRGTLANIGSALIRILKVRAATNRERALLNENLRSRKVSCGRVAIVAHDHLIGPVRFWKDEKNPCQNPRFAIGNVNAREAFWKVSSVARAIATLGRVVRAWLAGGDLICLGGLHFL
jgi:hypothetical protein